MADLLESDGSASEGGVDLGTQPTRARGGQRTRQLGVELRERWLCSQASCKNYTKCYRRGWSRPEDNADGQSRKAQHVTHRLSACVYYALSLRGPDRSSTKRCPLPII